VLEKREYEDYERLGQEIQKAYQALYDIDLRKANEALKAAVATSTSMWGDEDPQIRVAVRSLRNLQRIELHPYIERLDLRSAGDIAYVARKQLSDLRYKFHEAFLRDIWTHQAFLAKVKLTRIPIAYVYSPFFSDEENLTICL
jgi:hypothetical protein